MTDPTECDYAAAEADIAAYWESLQSAENPNGIWYLHVGDINNLLDMATEEIKELRGLVLFLMELDPSKEVLDKEKDLKRALQVAKIYKQEHT